MLADEVERNVIVTVFRSILSLDYEESLGPLSFSPSGVIRLVRLA